MNAASTHVEAGKATAKAARILIVEDERIVARSLGKQLTRLNYDVVGSVASGEEAVAQSGGHRPDLVLMDIHLKGAMDGVAAAGKIRTQFRLPVVYLTAYSTREILDRAKLTEPFGYILKPYQERELHVVIETALYKHQAERRRHKREQWFVATLKSICDAVVATDDEGRVTFMNTLAEGLTGWASQDALGQPLGEVVRLIHEDSREPLEFPNESAPQVAIPNAAIVLLARDRSEKAVEICVSIIRDQQVGALGRVVVFRNVTRWKRQEKQLQQAKKMEAIGQLAGGVAHAFNNLMTTVLGYNEIMLEGMKPGDPFFAGAQEIHRAATRTATLTQKLLAFGRRQTLTTRTLDLNAVVGGLTKVIQYMRGGVRLVMRLEPNLGLTSADPSKLEDGIFTLVRNACEAMPHGGRVTIQTENIELEQDYAMDHPEVRPGPYVLLSVSDTGVGMSQEAISHLFEPFYTKKTGVGAGLGLAAVYGFVKQCGGDIAVQSELDKGTTFQLFLPRAEEQPGKNDLSA